MQLNVRKIEARIQKLQEIRRIAADPELVSMLLEFLGADDDVEAIQAAKPHQSAASAAPQDDMDIVEPVLNGKDPRASSHWSAKRA